MSGVSGLSSDCLIFSCAVFQEIGSSEIAPVSAMAEDLESKRRCVQGLFAHVCS